MAAWTSASCWRWALADASVLIVPFAFCCLIACLIVAPYLAPHAPFAPPHHNAAIERRPLGQFGDNNKHYDINFTISLVVGYYCIMYRIFKNNVYQAGICIKWMKIGILQFEVGF